MLDVTVVLCTYNGERFLPEFLQSLSRQVGGWAEFIVYDDGSTDGTLAIIDDFTSSYQGGSASVRVIVNDGQSRGASQAFSFAASHATRAFVAFADQDDIWDEERLFKAVEVLRGTGTDLVASDADIVQSNGDSVGRSVFDQFESRFMSRQAMLDDPMACLLRQNYLPGMTMTARRDALQAWLPVPTGWLHDYWFAVRAAERGRLRVLPEALVHYRQHSSNVLGVQKQISAGRLVRALIGRVRNHDSSRVSTADWTNVSERLGPVRSASVAEKVRFEVARSRLGGRYRICRVLSILGMIRDYRRFSHIGIAGAIKDLI